MRRHLTTQIFFRDFLMGAYPHRGLQI